MRKGALVHSPLFFLSIYLSLTEQDGKHWVLQMASFGRLGLRGWTFDCMRACMQKRLFLGKVGF